MTREMMEMIFTMVCVETGCDWFEVFDSDLFEVVCSRIAAEAGLGLGDYDSWADMLDEEIGGEFSAWVSEMGGDL